MTGWVERRRSRPFRCCKLFHGFAPERRSEKSRLGKAGGIRGAEGGIGGDRKRIGMSDGSSDHMKGDGRADGGLGLMVGIVGSKVGGAVDSKGSNKDDKKLDTGGDREATGGIDNKTGTVDVIGIKVGDSEARDCKSNGVNVGKGIEGMGGLVCEPTSEVMINESRGGSGTLTAVGVKKVSSSGSKSTCTLTSIWSL